MLESDKLGRKIHNLELPWAMVKVLITDEGLAAADAAQIEQQGVKVIRVAV
jgi:DeoR/GlpR family transcriptional regulator of sugar metabolism